MIFLQSKIINFGLSPECFIVNQLVPHVPYLSYLPTYQPTIPTLSLLLPFLQHLGSYEHPHLATKISPKSNRSTAFTDPVVVVELGSLQCDQPWQNFTNFGQILKVFGNFSGGGLFSIWPIFEPTLVIFVGNFVAYF